MGVDADVLLVVDDPDLLCFHNRVVDGGIQIDVVGCADVDGADVG